MIEKKFSGLDEFGMNRGKGSRFGERGERMGSEGALNDDFVRTSVVLCDSKNELERTTVVLRLDMARKQISSARESHWVQSIFRR